MRSKHEVQVEIRPSGYLNPEVILDPTPEWLYFRAKQLRPTVRRVRKHKIPNGGRSLLQEIPNDDVQFRAAPAMQGSIGAEAVDLNSLRRVDGVISDPVTESRVEDARANGRITKIDEVIRVDPFQRFVDHF
jgi:hypothetical protein